MTASRATSSKRRTRLTAASQPDPDLNGLLAEPRRMKILDWLQEEGSARVRDLSTAFAVSEATIRQDLEKLESDGHIIRQHGGAFLRTVPKQVETLSLQHMENIEKKRKIGIKAASLVGEGETIILDAGSTTTEIAHNLLGRSSLTVITNALNIALMLGAAPGYAVHMPGGQFKAPTLSLSGDKAADYFQDVFAGKLFLATAGVALDSGLTYPSFADLQLKQAMIRAASRVYLVADFDQDQPIVVHPAQHTRCHPFLHHRRRHSRRGRPSVRKPRHRGDHRPIIPAPVLVVARTPLAALTGVGCRFANNRNQSAGLRFEVFGHSRSQQAFAPRLIACSDIRFYA